VGHGIDQRQRRVAVLILQRPDLAGVRIVFQAIDGTRDRVGVSMFPALSYWMIVLGPSAPLESAPLPYSTKNEPVSVVMESGALSPFDAVAKVFTVPTKAISILPLV
jgi:hypothetical protein